MNLVVYYHKHIDPSGTISVVVTDKEFWDKNNAVDDGFGPHYNDIHSAMWLCGATEVEDSVYELSKGLSFDDFIAKLHANGIDMTVNQDFTDWCEECDACGDLYEDEEDRD